MAITFKAIWYEPKGRMNKIDKNTLYTYCTKKEWILNTIIVSSKARSKKNTKHVKEYMVEENLRILDYCVGHIQ